MEGKLNYRYIARLIVKAQTPLFVGSGKASLLKDALVQKDCYGLPMIPGTSLTGVLRHAVMKDYDKSELSEYSDEKLEKYFSLLDFFGCQIRDSTLEDRFEKKAFEKWYKERLSSNKRDTQTVNIPDGLGSRLIVSSASFLLGNERVAEDLDENIPEELIRRLDNLPVRQHVRINEKGVAEKNKLFDNEVVYKGARFVFEVELKGTASDKQTWEKIISLFKNPLFRIGQGTRNGYGNLKVEKVFEKTYNLEDKKDFKAYLNFDPSFNTPLSYEPVEKSKDYEGFTQYSLILKPDDFFIFNEGFGDTDVDYKPVTEEVIEYNNGEIKFIEQTLIPGSSIKGALAHRVAYHYNKIKGNYADKLTAEAESSEYIGEENEAVAKLFGRKGEIKGNENTGTRGLLIFDDQYYNDVNNDKIFNHIAIDRFTGGGIDGALFSEKVSYKKDEPLEFKIIMAKTEVDDQIQEALEEALKDICKGLLPLGGMTTKGFGMFTGTLKKDGKLLFDYKNQMA